MIEIKVLLNDKLLQKTTFSRSRITIGRSEENDVVLADKLVSRIHAVIEKRGGQYLIEDRSTNGTYLNQARVRETQPLTSECTIGIYPFTLHCTALSDEVTHPLVHSGALSEASLPKVLPSGPAPQRLHFGLLIGEDPSMHRVYKTIQRVADSAASVLIRGESGTGKELVARAIHAISSRQSSPFVALDCAAIPDNLLESELFGYEKGAFTGAAAPKKGWFEEAQGGTIFLDEIGELSASAQAKLLRFLQDKSYTRLGGNRVLNADVRLITATNKDLEEAIRAGQFRSDLYFRLRVVQIHLPSIRDRRGDIPLMTEHILSRIAKEHKLSQRPVLTAKAMAKLQACSWPGNVRQMENALLNAFINTPPPHVMDETDLDLQTEVGAVNPTFESLNRQLLVSTLQDCQWDTAKAAKILNVSRGTIYYKCKKLGINIKQMSRTSL